MNMRTQFKERFVCQNNEDENIDIDIKHILVPFHRSCIRLYPSNSINLHTHKSQPQSLHEMKPSMNAVLAAIALLSIQNANVQSFTSPNSHLARSSFLPKQSHSHSTKTRNMLASKGNENEDDDAWDSDVDYDQENTPNKNTNLDIKPNLGVNIGTQLEPITKSQAKKLKEEEYMKYKLKKDFETSKEKMRFASDLRAIFETESRMDKIGEIGSIGRGFSAKNAEELRTGTKLVDNQVKGDDERRIMVVCDDKVSTSARTKQHVQYNTTRTVY